MNWGFLNKDFALSVLAFVFIFIVLPLIARGREWEAFISDIWIKFLAFIACVIVIYYVVPNLSKIIGVREKGFKQITFRDLESSNVLHSKLVSEISKNGDFEYFSKGYKLKLWALRKPFGIASLQKDGVTKYYCIYDGLKGADKILIAGAESFHELLRLFGVKNVRELGNVLVREREFMTQQEWMAQGEKLGFLKQLRGE